MLSVFKLQPEEEKRPGRSLEKVTCPVRGAMPFNSAVHVIVTFSSNSEGVQVRARSVAVGTTFSESLPVGLSVRVVVDAVELADEPLLDVRELVVIAGAVVA